MINSITKLELKKIISNKAVKVGLSLVLVYIIVALIGSIQVARYESVNDSLNTIEELKGMKAINQKKVDVEKVKGYLDEKSIKEIISNYNKLRNNKNNLTAKGELKDDVCNKYWVPYSDIQNLLLESYVPLNTIDDNVLDKLAPNSSKEFYSNRIKQIKDSLNLNYKQVKFDESDVAAITDKAKNLTQPMYYEYADGWFKLMDNLPFLNILIILILCFSVCRTFTEDIQNGMILVVLPTINGKTKLAFSKIKASIIFAGTTYLVLNFLFAVLLLSFYGASGWNCPIQINSRYWLSIYNLKCYEVYLSAIILGLIACLFMVMLTLLLGTILKKAVLTISAVSIFLLAPLLINTDKLPNILNNVAGLLPINAVDYMEAIRRPYMYNIFGMEILRSYITPIILLIISIVIIPLVVKVYNKQEA
ncbi:ABC-2 family transporter protein [Clostridium saccharobutylicum]|uniref:hypothetical protein n=1 Tax=Clostridium saccharobutylicum TaxID=169679 RepID=UPI000983A0E5|nr:hypothetical protein [Clostridium saccharobutylicum]AQS11336.1 ABC-2 family transporter protein [Clostridium saccharobutylicum]MBC2437126.1 hypothetical protein [Clostridium saccharobutylicum]NSB88731.1 hypothetical protein [Clostridium saccharobutylicum]NYC30691.1 hypothetical protein [Clostridium saccharobutylicum]OOM15426.1 ABC-2 family transporter protein [Clostridium saccharobutylicum]